MEKGREQWWVAEPTDSQEHRTALEALTSLSSDAIPEPELRGHLPLPHCCGASIAGSPEQRLLSAGPILLFFLLLL